jgi:hypothetical protein
MLRPPLSEARKSNVQGLIPFSIYYEFFFNKGNAKLEGYEASPHKIPLLFNEKFTRNAESPMREMLPA